MALSVEDARPEDLAAIAAVNNAAVPAVNALTAEEMGAVAALGALRIVRTGGAVGGLVLTIPEGQPYASLNYRWFSGEFDAFLYVDRIVVAPEARGLGVGRALYEDTFARARSLGRPRVCAEVNVEPPNPGSMAFHAATGFNVLLDRFNEEAGKTVRMMERPV
ncbi:GNAT family N-acetyltransferase [Acuticoccus sp. I52.16.1]|uniref:GNAT family N-acetyltransferase n=1 Tax=Acuticoccus sp. I52.16.1 TaxID=2928472 RepID=UPI001FD082B3|nr:GNAT family N-acetyltransferase [Acuticoccus sp. I52.16.1]UOM36862.1 GNAT family N-acetyltransferase [Acuticoccus sp. I52.16.1]